MSKLTRYCLFTALAAGMSLGFSARAEILVYDGFPTGSGAYPTADKSTIKSYGNALTTEKIVGFEKQNWGSGTAVIYVFGNGTGLSLPDSFADLPSAVNIGSGSAGAYSSGQSDGERGVYRQLTSATVSAIRKARELHFRFLLSADAKALGALVTNSSTASLPEKSAFGAGLYLSESSAYGSYRNSNAKTARSIGFAIRRVMADCFKLCLVIVGAEDSFTTGGQVRVYDLVESVTAGATYLCYARIDVNAGADGKEQIQAFAQDVSDYDPSALLCDAVEANLIDDAGTGAPNSLNFAAGSYMTNGGYFKVDEFALATAAEDIMFLGKAGVSRLKDAAMTGDSGSYTVSAMVTKAAATDTGAIADDGTTATAFSAGDVAENSSFSTDVSLSSLSPDKTYQISAYAENAIGAVTNVVGTAYNGTLTLAKVKDADECQCVPGEVSVSRKSADPYPLKINYKFASAKEGAAAGKTWVAPQPVVIPAGEISTTIYLQPLVDVDIGEDIQVSVSLEDGNYLSGTIPVVLTLKNLATPEGYNAWVAPVAGKASVASNWSEGRVPNSTDKVLFDGDISNADCEWDGGVNGLTDTVAAWSQSVGYTGTVTIMTTFPEIAESSFHVFTVTGDMTLEGGTVTHAAHNSTHKCDYYRLRMDVGGDLNISAGASLSAYCKGSFGKHANGADASYGGSYNSNRAWGSLERPYGVGASSSSGDGKNPVGYPAWAGGAIWVEVAGKTVLDGKIAAEGIHVKTQWDGFSGSGGAVYLKTKSLEGTGTISGSADAGNASSNDKSGAGGRVAVVLTESELTAFPVANITAYSSVSSYENVGGAGTVYVKSPQRPNGVLYLRDRSNKYAFYNYRPKVSQVTDIPKNQTWRLDGIVIGANSILRVPTDATLDLVNGLDSVTSTTGASLRDSGIYIDGGTLVLSAGDQTISGTWTFHARGITIDRNVTVDNGGAIGSLGFFVNSTSALQRCELTVTGDLTVNSGASICASYGGYIAASANVPGRTAISCHGGQNAQSVGNCAYDSFFSPGEAGAFGNDVGRYNVGGGVVKLVVGGTMTLNGSATAKPGCDSSRPGAAGTINIMAARLEGTGSINADGNSREYYDSSMAGKYNMYGASGGGRVAVRLTGAGADFTPEWISKITAMGVASNVGDKQANSSSAGSVYLQSAAQGEKCGSIIIRNDGTTANDAWTSLPGKDGVDAVADFKNASLSLLDCGKVRLYDTLAMSKLTMSVDTKLDLNGKTLTVRSAKLGDTTLAAATYAASDYSDYLTDSVGGGSLVVQSGSNSGLVIFFR